MLASTTNSFTAIEFEKNIIYEQTLFKFESRDMIKIFVSIIIIKV